MRSTLQILHENDIVCGDVNPCNVAIDEEYSTWIVDFGGLNNAEFVDEDKAETREDYWQGVDECSLCGCRIALTSLP